MSNAVYPAQVRGLGWAVMKSFEFKNIMHSSPGMYTTAVSVMKNPYWRFELLYNYLKDNPSDIASGLTYTDLKTLVGFCMARAGQGDDFLFNDPTDNYVGPALNGSSPNLDAQLPLVTDGLGTYYSPIQRIVANQFAEDITDLNGAITVYQNGTLTTGYSVNGPGLAISGNTYAGKYLTWNKLPAPGAPTLSQVAGGSLGATTYYVRITYVTATGETNPSNESNLAVSANNLLHVTSPAPASDPTVGAATGWNVYVMLNGVEQKQNSSPIAIGTDWTEPTGGLVSGAGLPVNSTRPAAPITAQFNFYFRVRMSSDARQLANFMNQLWAAGGSGGGQKIKFETSRVPFL